MHTVLLSLGANLADPIATITRAVEMLGESVLENIRLSPLYSTEPVGVTDQPPFINAAVAGTTTKSAREVHDACKNIEILLGRQHRQRWHEREIDIDVILVGSEILDDEDVHIPHLRMQERRFVLQPACDLAPDAICPRTQKPLAQLLEECQDQVSRPRRVERE
jgi:2-amino-4-hydroxy-6-hydroxymethyldihydropteridine diphosphokinase